MKTFAIMITIILFSTPSLMAAGSSSSAPAVSSYQKTFNKGVDLMRDNEK